MLPTEHPLFSIIIPTYNSERTLRASLDSIVAQHYKEVEVFVQDGMSSDKTVKIANTYKEKLPHLKVVSEKDEGIYDAMNKALLKVNGSWVLFLGSDDTLHDAWVLEKVSEKIKSTTAKVLYGDAQIIGDTGWAKDGDIYAGVFTIEKLLNQNICHQAMFYNTNFIKDEIGVFNSEYPKSGDWDFNIRCWAKMPFEYLGITVANFKAGGFSTYSNDIRFSEEYVQNILNYFDISPFHALVNRKDFVYYGKVVTLQKEKYPLLFALISLKNKIVRKFN